jgi:23S rRNA pseudouridine1911/1915/1917 synthase
LRLRLRSERYPLLGDPIYGFKTGQFPFAVPRVMLHAARIAITHPVTGKALDIRAALPKDFDAAMTALTALPAVKR